MGATVKQFEKDGKSFPILVIKKDEAKPESFGFVFGVSKARLILANIESIQKFVKDNTPGDSK